MTDRNSGPGRADREGISLFKLMEMFPDEASARRWFEDTRWPDGNMFCPHCDSDAVGPVKHPTMPYRCSTCYKYFSVKTGSVMHGSKVPLITWLYAIYLISTNLKGVSSMKLHRDLGISQKTAWHLMHKIREGFLIDPEQMTGPVEVDETFIGGRKRNKKNRKEIHGLEHLTPVVGIRDRITKEIIALPVNDRTKQTLQGIIHRFVEQGGTVYTDEHRGYQGLQGYRHETVNHSVGQYVNLWATTNGIESFWSLLKRGYHGTYHQMSVKHLHRYINEFAGRNNVRDLDTLDQMVLLTLGMMGRRLRYKDITDGV